MESIAGYDDIVDPVDFIYDDGTFFALNKPAGIHSVSIEGGGYSLADRLLEIDPALAHVAPRPGDAGLVQRLDLETSGVILGARTREAWDQLHSLLTNGKVEKRYIALLDGTPPRDMECSTFLGTPQRHSKKVKVYEKHVPQKVRALFGTSVFKLIISHPHQSVSLVEISASPARRHQVRAQAAHLGFPLTGDRLYGSSGLLGEIAVHEREFFLHAWTIEFTHPLRNEVLKISAPFTPLLRWPEELPYGN